MYQNEILISYYTTYLSFFLYILFPQSVYSFWSYRDMDEWGGKRYASFLPLL